MIKKGGGRPPHRSSDRSKGPSRSTRWSQNDGVSYRIPNEGEWFLAGVNGVREALRSPRVKVRHIFVDPRAMEQDMRDLLRQYSGPIEELKGRETPFGMSSQGIAALVAEPLQEEGDTLLERLKEEGKVPLLVALDQVEDPMNLGQILRTCEGAGVDGVILLKHRSIHLNQTVAQVSQGAFAWIPVLEVTNLRNSLEFFKERDLWVVGCEGSEDAEPWSRCELTLPTVLVFGAEGQGMRPLTRKTCDRLGRLPMNGHMESLNVGAAVSAFVYEAVRQRLASK